MKDVMTMRNAVCEDEALVEPPWSMAGVAKLEGGAMCLISLGLCFVRHGSGQCGQQSASCRPSVGAGFYLSKHMTGARTGS